MILQVSHFFEVLAECLRSHGSEELQVSSLIGHMGKSFDVLAREFVCMIIYVSVSPILKAPFQHVPDFN